MSLVKVVAFCFLALPFLPPLSHPHTTSLKPALGSFFPLPMTVPLAFFCRLVIFHARCLSAPLHCHLYCFRWVLPILASLPSPSIPSQSFMLDNTTCAMHVLCGALPFCGFACSSLPSLRRLPSLATHARTSKPSADEYGKGVHIRGKFRVHFRAVRLAGEGGGSRSWKEICVSSAVWRFFVSSGGGKRRKSEGCHLWPSPRRTPIHPCSSTRTCVHTRADHMLRIRGRVGYPGGPATG